MKRAFNPLALFLLAVCLLIGTTAAWSQSDFEKTIKEYNSDAVTGYLQPITDMFGSNMHTGYFHGAEVETWGFHFRLDLVAMGTMVKDEQKMYMAKAPAGFTPATFETPTVFGGKATEVVDQATGLRFKGSDGIINAPYFPLAVPQLTIGNIYGTQATIRYITVPNSISNGEIPPITLWGLGARHSISQYIPDCPVDLAAGIYFNSFTFGDMINFKGTAINAQASKSFSVLTLYTGVQWEKSSMNLSYKPSTGVAGATPMELSFDFSGANSFRFAAGLALDLGPIHLYGDANMGAVTTVSAGIGFGN